jgi:HPt (histidine-containing phosphotransfer) domain-containing protein
MGSGLPAEAVDALRDAFAGEVAERLPRLREAAASADTELLRVALRDVHTLGSSAYVVGADDIAVAARAAEACLVDDAPHETFAALVADLDRRLRERLG